MNGAAIQNTPAATGVSILVSFARTATRFPLCSAQLPLREVRLSVTVSPSLSFFFHPTPIPRLVPPRRERINSAPRANLERRRSNRSTRPELLVLSPFATMYRAIIRASRKSNRSTQLSINFSISLHRYVSPKTHFSNCEKTSNPEIRYIWNSRVHRT